MPDAKPPRRLRGPNKIKSELAIATERLPGETVEEHKRRYARENMRRWREKNKGKEAARRIAAYPLIRDAENARQKKWREENPERFKATQKRFFDKNREKRIQALVDWRAANPERFREVRANWQKNNKDVIAAAAARCRARAIQATPKWADWKEIQKVYGLAKKMTRRTGIMHQVDHIVPLGGKNVCGLHVHYNLRVIPATENLAKRNYFDEALALSL